MEIAEQVFIVEDNDPDVFLVTVRKHPRALANHPGAFAGQLLSST